ncbi:hypothetical protein AB0N29_01825 [Nocardioides sp. NPDC092400]|uniref:hypothetical protein n=1 Tax=Nocardioides sp. NPDC092400 TaxID=3155196 RepID=UPI00341650F9
MAADPSATAKRSYTYLRLGMAGVLLALAFSIGYEVVSEGGCWQRSISAYYYTASRAVFVGALVALALAMITVLGSTPAEDVGLNLAGLFAPVVAFVPTREFDNCSLLVSPATIRAAEARGDAIRTARAAAAETAEAAVVNNMVTYLLVVAAALALLKLMPSLAARRDHDADPNWRTTLRLSYGAGWAFCVAYAAWLTLAEDHFKRWAHLTSAISLFVCIVVVVVATAYDRTATRDVDEPTRVFLQSLPNRLARALPSRYGLIAAAMIIGFLGCVVVRWATGWVHWFLVIEILMIALFAVFWIVQTLELWDRVQAD